MTTFGGLTLSSYATRRPSLPSSIPIVDTINPGDSPNLHLEREEVLRKQSYVRLDKIYKTDMSSLRSYNPDIGLPAYNWRLDEKSYRKLMSLLLLEAQDYPPTDSVKSARKTHKERIPICAPGATATQDQRNAYTPQRVSSEPVLIIPPSRIQTHQTHHSPPHGNYNTITQLPPPTTQPNRRQQSSCSSKSTVTFFVCLLWLLFFYAVCRLWQ